MKAEHPIVGDVRAKGCLMGIELVKDRRPRSRSTRPASWSTRRPSARAWPGFPAGHILRMSPPIVMDDEALLKGLDIIDEAIGETEKELP